MTAPEIAITLRYLRPGEEWSLNGDDYSGLVWISPTEPPSLSDLENAYENAKEAAIAAEQEEIQARQLAISHAKSLGFTDDMIAVMYPGLAGYN